MEESKICGLLEIINQNLNEIVLNQAHIYAELDEIKEGIREQNAE